MGKEVLIVYLYGIPKTMLDLLQQVGRCAPDGQKGIILSLWCSRDMLDLWQHAERCAPDGQRGIVYLYCVPRDMRDLWQQAGWCAHYLAKRNSVL